WRAFTPDQNYYRVAPAGGLNASIDDMAQWVRAQLGHAPRVVSDEALSDIHAERVRTPKEFVKNRWMGRRLRDADYALGWRVYDYAGERLVFHAGGVAGYRAVVALLPEKDLGLAVLWNSSSSRGWRIMPTLLDAYLDLAEQDWLRVSPILASSGSRTSRGSP
ncbi:MAG: serine hydrolase, partial [Caulobacterales bacterium]|nr:serine hydrolase [Caulobacterales bacterium]